MRTWCRAVHRDLGYFFFGATVVYAISGIALNHRNDWNPSYSLERRELELDAAWQSGILSRDAAIEWLKSWEIAAHYQNHYSPAAGQWKIFFKNGSATVDETAGNVVIESLQRRPLLHTFNKLHYNPGNWWTWFADIFSGALIVIAVSGLFLLRGKHGITRRGGILVAAGILLPGILVAFYL
jgi:hypothetical protein